jgi:hypothetical protein
MKKIRLDLDALDVVSFATDSEPDAPRGTIHGHNTMTPYFTLGQPSCYGGCATDEYHTCWEAGPSVGPSCDYICQEPSVGCYPPDWTEACA